MSHDDDLRDLTPFDLLSMFGQARAEANKLGMNVTEEEAERLSSLLLKLPPIPVEAGEPAYFFADDFARLKAEREQASPGQEYTAIDFFHDAWAQQIEAGTLVPDLVDKHDPALVEALLTQKQMVEYGKPLRRKGPKLTLLDGGKSGRLSADTNSKRKLSPGAAALWACASCRAAR